MTRIIERELIPTWGARDPNKIKSEEVEAWVRAFARGQGRKKATPYLANRSMMLGCRRKQPDDFPLREPKIIRRKKAADF